MGLNRVSSLGWVCCLLLVSVAAWGQGEVIEEPPPEPVETVPGATDCQALVNEAADMLFSHLTRCDQESAKLREALTSCRDGGGAGQTGELAQEVRKLWQAAEFGADSDPDAFDPFAAIRDLLSLVAPKSPHDASASPSREPETGTAPESVTGAKPETESQPSMESGTPQVGGPSGDEAPPRAGPEETVPVVTAEQVQAKLETVPCAVLDARTGADGRIRVTGVVHNSAEAEGLKGKLQAEFGDRVVADEVEALSVGFCLENLGSDWILVRDETDSRKAPYLTLLYRQIRDLPLARLPADEDACAGAAEALTKAHAEGQFSDLSRVGADVWAAPDGQRLGICRRTSWYSDQPWSLLTGRLEGKDAFLLLRRAKDSGQGEGREPAP